MKIPLGSRLQSFTTILALMLALLAGCSNADKAAEVKPEVKIGRLICGGHLSLAVVENMYQNDLSSFRLKTVQNHVWDDVVNDMKTGKMAGTFILSPLAMKMIRDGVPAKIVLMADRNGNGFVLSTKHKSIAELKGKNTVIAVPHIYSQHHVLLYLALKQHAVPYSDVKVVGMPPRDMINSLQRGEIDGFVVGEPEGNKSIALGVGWMASISPKIWKDHLDHVFLASNAFIEQHPNQAQELISALKKGGLYIEGNPHQAAVMGEDYTGSSAAVFEQVLTDPPDWIDYSDMIPSDERVRAMADVMVEMGLWKDIPDNLAEYTDQRFILKASEKQ
ncbi:ABC-type nitrate/sulfonate/bicarbonate transport system, substrate-binding protein [Mariprofundus aestuarium]|uniref:ABC-type nitrate/sulfonate/bicarbonate transport system, substrate-binding protein n=1 Tax=Mariprofundus aestuarium TaxID=1921086 RepID=A0A2K8KX87_MARES|nr:ABC transporter substrate-binding protein [Mariprofundus aestuarium]ATX79322.1 ABC-type nitrate/sulfonate/bicarbonate transport system, substrate-binding protein [Mariprofundus aestuarium]